jgi:glycopeptide antibiotics resistance protein
MPCTKLKNLILGLYIPVLVVGLTLPRRPLVDPESVGLIRRLFRQILYLTGPSEVFLNLLLFIPIFFALLLLAREIPRTQCAIFACLLSAAAELVQSQIPGRVSSLRDFMCNSVGVGIAFGWSGLLSMRGSPERTWR